MLEVKNLSVQVGGRTILHDVNLEIAPGEVHVLFGPNGSGKSTLLSTIMGFSGYEVVQGQIIFNGQDITFLPVDQRSQLGIGLLFQRPPTVRGVTTRQIVQIAGKGKADVEGLAHSLKLEDFLDRDVNHGFSGGEIKRSELLQLLAQDPSLVLLDEPESGVDIENIALIGNAIAGLLERRPELSSGKTPREARRQRRKSGLVITHTGYILDYITADVGHVMYDGHLSCSGNPRELLNCIQSVGYEECVRCIV